MRTNNFIHFPHRRWVERINFVTIRNFPVLLQSMIGGVLRGPDRMNLRWNIPGNLHIAGIMWVGLNRKQRKAMAAMSLTIPCRCATEAATRRVAA